MRKHIVVLILVILVLSAVQDVDNPKRSLNQLNEQNISHSVLGSTASASGRGNSHVATMFFDRTISEQEIEIFNTYRNTVTHSVDLDLSPYLISGWRLSNVQIITSGISAALEREVVADTFENLDFSIAKISGTFYPQIAQGFYNFPHDGVLVNYSIYYSTALYDPDLRGNASFVVRRGNAIETASDITTHVNMTASDAVPSWAVLGGENALLYANTLHWAVIDGSLLQEFASYYPYIYWMSEDGAGIYPSKRKGTTLWNTYNLEALMNYTYIPWNQTAGAPLTYSSPQQVDLKCNASTITSLSFDFFSSTKNITSISFDTNQSVYFNYNMTLSYVRETTALASWEVESSGNQVDWNVTFNASYPSVSGQVSRYLNCSKATSWTITGLYESAAPSTNHSDYSIQGTIVRCASMTNGTWRFEATSHNHLSTVNTYNSSDDAELIRFASILVDIDVNLTILEDDSDPVKTGLANLTIVKSDSVVWAPTNKSVIDGKVNYLWNIDATTSENGAFILEVSWSNGTDAGYLSKEIIVFFPTLLTTSTPSIDAFTESIFDLIVYFEDTFTPQGLDGANAIVAYSFDGGTNTSMVDHNNGTWTATISTAGKTNGTYSVQVYAQGYALENHSITIDVILIHDTQPLVIEWSDGSDISYVQTTTLYVDYLVAGGSPIPKALVNVSIDDQSWLLHWNSISERYWICFNGTDTTPGFGNHSLTIEAWKYGYKYQIDNEYNLTISREQTSLDILWDTSNIITYVGSTTLIANYTMSNGSAVVGAEVNVTIGTGIWNMTWNDLTKVYELVILGNDTKLGLDGFSVFVFAGKIGYVNATKAETLTINPEPTSLMISWSDGKNITYIETTTLFVTYRMSDTTPIINAILVVTIMGETYDMFQYNETSYRLTFNGTDIPQGFATFNLEIAAHKYGFENSSNTNHWITLREEPTSIEISWSNGDNITFVQSTILSINFTMSNGYPVLGANVTATIGLDSLFLDYDEISKTYRVLFLGTDEPPGIGVHDLELSALAYGFENKTDIWLVFTINLELTTLDISWNPDDDITFASYSILSVNYQMSNGTTIIGANVNMTIGDDFWEIQWNETSKLYQIRINGSDLPPGFGNHSILIQASKKGYVPESTNVTVLMRIEPTSLVIEWSNGFEPGFFEYTYLFVDYRNAALGTIYDANVNVTIGTYNWRMTWNETAERYQIRFNGSDSVPGVGNYSLLIKAGKTGYINLENSSMRLILPVVPTTLVLEFTSGMDISYVQQTTIRAYYRIYNTTPVLQAEVNVTVEGSTHKLIWNSGTEAYEYTFFGSDSPPGFGNHSLVILAGAVDFEEQSDYSTWLNIRIELTSLDISWSNGFNITYFNQTTLSVRYLMSDGISPISSAVLNATINGKFYELIWNGIEAYETTILGSDNPPGYGTHDVIILAAYYGFQYQNKTVNFTIRVQDTFLRFEWDPDNIISYVNTTIFRIYYFIDESSPVPDAIVNATIGITTWNATYNEGTKAYEVYFRGLDFSPPEFQVIQVKASKTNYLSLEDTSQSLTINEEKTSIFAYWTNGNSITFIETTTLLVNYTMSNGTTIVPDIWTDITVTIGSDTLTLTWDAGLHLYKRVFTGSDDPPGLGTHGLYVRCYKPGYKLAENSSLILYIMAADVEIACKWLGPSTITYVQSTTLEVNYTTSEGNPIEGATVNVSISGHLWNLTWHSISQTYRITFNGTDNPPGFGLNHLLDILAWKSGFNHTRDTSKKLSIIEEFTTLTAYWSDPNQNEVTYFEYTYLFVNYRMSNGSDIVWAIVNASCNGNTWQLEWNSTEMAFGIRFNGSDNPPGLGIWNLTISASAYGFEQLDMPDVTLILAKDPSSLEVSWSTSNNITYVEQTLLMVYYKMSNNSLISIGTVIATIGEDEFPLVWNSSTGAYHFLFKGNMDPPGIENHSVFITAYANIYANSTISTSLTIRKEITTAYASWVTKTIDWTQSVNISFQYLDSYGRLIENVSQQVITIDGTEYILFGTNGTYWFELDNSFDLGPHTIMANISKFGYFFALNESISLNIIEAYTTLSVVWSSTSIDYLGQINLEVTYAYSGTGEPIPMGIVEVNMTVDGFPGVDFEARDNVWIANLTGADDLDLGTHYIIIRAQSYGYKYNETDVILIVSPVDTNDLAVVWSPSNVTIEYTDRLNLTVDYTYSGGDVPEPAFVNVSINGKQYDLEYLGAVWSVSIPGEELDIGIYDAFISAWAHGFAGRTNLTFGINVTFAANAFIVQWVPDDLSPTYIDTINVSVRYLADYKPIINATVTLFINETSYYLTYSSIDQIWHISLKARDIGLGVWNVTVTANKTGYADGWNSRILTISPALTNLTVLSSALSIYYDEDLTLEIYYQLLNSSFVPNAALTLEVDGKLQTAIWGTDHWTYTSSGNDLGVGIHPFYVHVAAFGYQDAIEFFDIVVDEIPTAVLSSITNVTIFAYETTAVLLTWTDTRYSVNISGCTPEITWPDSYSVVDHGNGSYSLQIESESLHVGNYQLFVKFVSVGYENGTAQVNINIRELPIVLIYESEIQQFENESIAIFIKMFDGPHASIVSWGEIIIELDDIEYILVYDSDSEQYSIEIWLASLDPGSYSLNFSASAIDCETEYGEIQLEVIPKSTYTLNLEVDEEVLSGQMIQIIISATNQSGPVNGITITFHIVIQRGQEATQNRIYTNTTNSNGLAVLEFTVPLDATRLTIWAEFEGSISEWPAISNTIDRLVTSTGIDILSFIFSLFSNPVTLILIIGGGGGLFGGLLVRRRRSVVRLPSTPIIETSISPSSMQTAPAGEMEIMQNEIKKHPEGMSRAQIAQLLEISSGKASALVRKLLDSDLGFEEVKEGRLGKIRFRGLE